MTDDGAFPHIIYVLIALRLFRPVFKFLRKTSKRCADGLLSFGVRKRGGKGSKIKADDFTTSDGGQVNLIVVDSRDAENSV
ncbi:MAG: hypothetical protein C4516_02295 [Oxalobacter sp.]|nr:MAG: hypothetical protein C4516_02295 [Oxalobacter sp.]